MITKTLYCDWCGNIIEPKSMIFIQLVKRDGNETYFDIHNSCIDFIHVTIKDLEVDDEVTIVSRNTNERLSN